MSDKIVVKLRKPLTVGDNLISELTLREPTIGEVITAEKAAGGDAERLLSIIGQVAGVDAMFLRAMSVRDFKAVGAVVDGYFLENGP